MLQEAIPDKNNPGDISALAHSIVTEYRARKEIIPGVGHPFHKPIDPRSEALFRVARETGYYGPYAELMTHIGAEAERQTKRNLPVNVTAAMAAVASQMDVPWKVCRGLAVAARAVGLVGHIIEEMKRPMADELYLRTEHEATAHMVPKV